MYILKVYMHTYTYVCKLVKYKIKIVAHVLFFIAMNILPGNSGIMAKLHSAYHTASPHLADRAPTVEMQIFTKVSPPVSRLCWVLPVSSHWQPFSKGGSSEHPILYLLLAIVMLWE